MKKINILFTALAVVAMASCSKEEILLQQGAEDGVARTFTCAFDESTKTNLVEGKTVWALGDTIWVSNGRASEKFGVPESSYGQKTFNFTSKLGGAIYVVYPHTAVVGDVDGDKLSINIKGNQDGNFGSANIAVAKTLDENVTLKNATSVMKFTISDDAMLPPVKFVNIHANGDALAGVCTVDLSSGSPVIAAPESGAGSDVSVATNGITGDFYVSVIPGTFKEGFSVSGINTDFKVDSRTTTVSNEIKVNDLVDLGTVGTNFKTLEGDGSEASPWLINNYFEMLAFAYHVRDGGDMKGEHVKLMTDINAFSVPVGYTDEDNGKEYSFQGSFDGNNKTIDVNINGATSLFENNIALFGVLKGGAEIKNLTITGYVSGKENVAAVAAVANPDSTGINIENVINRAKVVGTETVGGLIAFVDDSVYVKASHNYGDVVNSGMDTGGLVAYIFANSKRNARFEDCSSNGNIDGGNRTGGAVGYAGYSKFIDCSNNGTVNGVKQTAGLVGYTYYCSFDGCRNTGSVASSYKTVTGVYANEGYTNTTDFPEGVGGLLGFAQNSKVVDCSNAGNVEGFIKVGGVIGTAFWTPSTNVVNTGNVTATGDYSYNISSQMGYGYGSMSGGIVGWLLAGGDITNAKNSGIVSGKGGIGGIVGNAVATMNNNGPKISDCENTGKVVSHDVYAGGGISSHNASTGGIVGSMMGSRQWYITVKDCINKGDVSSDSRIVGGIVGHIVRLGAYTSYTAIGYPTVNGCVNEGNVSGTFWVGGVVGLIFGRVITQGRIENCANHGTIVGTRSDDNGEVVGGILGGVTTYTASYADNPNLHLRMRNCYNDGKILYTVKTHVQPYCGGILGNVAASANIQNVVNYGFVGNVSEEEPASKNRLGEIAGALRNGSYLSYTYYDPNGSIGSPVGAAGAAPTAATVTSFDGEGTLATPVTANSITCTTLLQALNEWQNYYKGDGNAYNNWSGPANKPVLDTTKD